MTVLYTDGEASAEFTVSRKSEDYTEDKIEKLSKTYDRSMPYVWIIAMIGAIILIGLGLCGKNTKLDFEGNLLEGKIPNKQKKYVIAWIAIHEDDLLANWKLLQEGQGYFKIQPLQ